MNFFRAWLPLFLTGLLILAGCKPPPSGPGSRSADQPPGNTPAGTIPLIFTYGSEKEEWVKEVTASFNAEGHRLGDGRSIVVEAVPLGSGDCMDELINGTRQAHLTSPASGAYIDLGNARWRAKTGKDLVAKTDTLLLSPVVIAMWKPMAEALGWGKRPVGWAEILALAKDPQGWASVGQGQWGAFKFGHTHPEYSNSGLISLLAETYAGAGKRGNLTLDDVRNPATAQYLAGIEQAVVHYGSSTGFFGKKMFANGPGYLNAAVLYENMVIESAKQPDLAFPVVAIYPKEGTFWSDHPVGVVEREWVTPAHREAAQAYISYLLATAQQQKAIPHGFRPGASDVPLTAPIDLAHGVNPKEPQNTLNVPSVEVMDAVLGLWKENKKHADIALVLDTSGSMNEQGGAKIKNAREGGLQLVSSLDDRDRFSLLLFNNRANWTLNAAPLSNARSQANEILSGLLAGGGTALYDSINLAFQRQLEAQQAHSERITAVVVLTDGADTDSQMPLEQLLAAIRSDNERKTIRVFTIAYGKDASVDVLQKIADATQAKCYKGTPENIRSVFRDIATFF